MTDRRQRGITCPKCKCCESRVLYTRAITAGRLRRRRECHRCKQRFTTYEHIVAVGSRVLNT